MIGTSAHTVAQYAAPFYKCGGKVVDALRLTAAGHLARSCWQIDFADGQVNFAGAGWRLQTVGQQKALQGDGVDPEFFQGGDVTIVQLEEGLLDL